MIENADEDLITFPDVLNRTAEPAPIDLRFKNIPLEEMRFLLNGPYNLYVGPIIGIPTCVTP